MSVHWLTAVLGSGARFKMEAAWGADLSDVDGSGWTWVEVPGIRHNPGMAAKLGRSDNVGQAGAASLPFTVDNSSGDYTPGGPNDVGVAQNTPIRYLISLDALATFSIRFQGYLDSANPVTDQSAKVKAVAMTALGMLGRLGGRKKPLRSALVRQTLQYPDLVAFWPLDDGASTIVPTQLVAGGPALSVNQPVRGYATLPASPVVFGAAGPVGAAGAVDLSNGGFLIANVSTSAKWSAGFAFQIIDGNTQVPPAPAGSGLTDGNLEVFRINCVGDGSIWFDYFNDGAGSSGLQVNYDGHTPFSTSVSTAPDDGQWHFVTVTGEQFTNGSGTFEMFTVQIDDETAFVSVLTTGDTIQPITSVSAGQTDAFGDATDRKFMVSNVFVADGCDEFDNGFDFAGPVPFNQDANISSFYGWTGETAQDRLTRLCAEEGIYLVRHGFADDTTMGPQSVDTILNLLRECEAADHGVLYDGLGPGIGYQCRSDRYNATAAVSLDMGADPPEVTTFGPIFDRQAIKNLYTVTRKGGVGHLRADIELGRHRHGRGRRRRGHHQHRQRRSGHPTCGLAGWIGHGRGVPVPRYRPEPARHLEQSRRRSRAATRGPDHHPEPGIESDRPTVRRH